MLRSMVHANPALVLLKDGVVVGKWAVSDIPDIEELENSPTLMPDALHSPYDRVKSWPFWAVVLSLIDVLLVQIARKERGNSSPKETADKTIDDSNTTY